MILPAGRFARAAHGIAACLALSAVAMAEPTDLTVPGPQGDLAGTYLSAGENAPVVLIVPGSGPTDRDGNSPLGIRASTYRLLAEGLGERGISSVRIDKRGMFGSAGAVVDANAVTIADYAADVHGWVGAIRERTGAGCVFVLGHSEGAVVALEAARRPDSICGLLLVSGPGRRLSDIMRAQLESTPANAPILPQALEAIATLDAGGTVDASALHPALAALFAPAVQPFLRDLFSRDPATMIAGLDLPVLILQGETDIQTSAEDARRLSEANPKAELRLLPGVNHLLKAAPADDLAANLATYSDPNLPLAPGVVDALAAFIDDNRGR